jgi:hypothetical protein
LVLHFPICRRASGIEMELSTYRRDPRKGFGAVVNWWAPL